MAKIIKDDEIKGMMKFKSQFGNTLLFHPRQLRTLKPDRKYKNTCHIETIGKRWFHVMNSILEVQAIYINAKTSDEQATYSK